MIDLDIPPCMKGGGNRNSRGDTTIVYALADPRNGTVRCWSHEQPYRATQRTQENVQW